MTSKKPQTISHLLTNPDGEVQALMEQLSRIKAINQSLSDLLDAKLVEHCHVANIRKNILVLAVDNAAWSNKLRFRLPDLLNGLRAKGFANLVNIEMIVQPK